MSNAPLLCHRCGAVLTPGAGDLHVVRIEAVADPFPPVIPESELEGSFDERVAATMQRLAELSEQEAMDQVYRRLTLHLCAPCYRSWIEDPTG